MKKLLFILLLIPFLSFAQNKGPISNFYLEDGYVQYRNVFTTDSISIDVIEKKLHSTLPLIQGVSNVQFENHIIRGEFRNYNVDFKKYGGAWGNVMGIINYPMDGKFIIEIKDGRYRLIISDAVFKSTQFLFPLTESVTRKKATEFLTMKQVLKSLEYMDKDFSDKFSYPKAEKKADW